MEASRLLLLVGDDAATRRVEETIRRRGYVPRVVEDAEGAVQDLAATPADVVVVVLPLHGSPSNALVHALRDVDRGTTIVVTGSDENIKGAPDALELGASEYVADPVGQPAELLGVIGVALGVRKSDAMLRHLRAKDHAGAERGAILGDCPAMKETLALVHQVCRRARQGPAPPILITGETGTGKSVLAKYIHYNSARRNEPFVDLNCATIAPTLIEAELFGHERGAFTDARTERLGLFETAHRGTLFLDEIGALPLELQPKLLTVIEDTFVRRIGGRVPIQVDVQIIAATLNDLKKQVANRTFREDLYHRLKVVRIRLPPLRERGEDIVRLAEHFVAQICKRYRMPPRMLTEDAKDAIRNYRWPGNVRELRNELERILLLEEGEVLDGSHFQMRHSIPPFRPPTPLGTPSVQSSGVQLRMPSGGISLESIERFAIEEALRRHHGNVSAAARFLSISRQTLIYRMRKHGLSKD